MRVVIDAWRKAHDTRWRHSVLRRRSRRIRHRVGRAAGALATLRTGRFAVRAATCTILSLVVDRQRGPVAGCVYDLRWMG
jgi:hypothetical protein